MVESEYAVLRRYADLSAKASGEMPIAPSNRFG